ncbi:MAG: EthD family reductase [bacterium]
MVKLIFLCTRRPDITHARYAELLLNGHVPIALTHHPTMRRYTVNIVERSPDGEAPLDSVGELSFDTLADFRERLYDSPEGEKIVGRDVAGFMGGAHAYATTEVVQKATVERSLGQRTAGMKLVCPVRRRPDITHAQFVEHWQTVHVPLALEHHPHMLRYVTNLADATLSPEAPDWDGFAEITLATPTAPMFGSAAGEAVIRADIARFIGHTFAYVVGEYVQRL